MKVYFYSGYVTSFGHIIGKFTTNTMATSKKKAEANIKYQFRSANNIAYNVPLVLCGDITEGRM